MQDYVIGAGSIQHNGRLVMDVVAHPAFQAGKTPTSFLSTHYPEGFQGVQLPLSEKQELVVCMVVLEKDMRSELVVKLGGIFGEAFKVERLDESTFKVTTMPEEGEVPEERIVQLDEQPSYKNSDILATVSLDGGKNKTVQMLSSKATGDMYVQMMGADVNILIQSPLEHELSAHMHPPREVDTSDMVLSPMPGTLINYAVEEGDVVEIGQELVVVEAMKMQNIIRSPRAGTIGTCRVAVGSSLKADEVILDFVVADEEAAPAATEKAQVAA